MLLTRMLNACHHLPRFVYAGARLIEARKTIEIEVRLRVGSQARCSGCIQPVRGYDQLPGKRPHGAFRTSWEQVCHAVEYVLQWAPAATQTPPPVATSNSSTLIERRGS